MISKNRESCRNPWLHDHEVVKASGKHTISSQSKDLHTAGGSSCCCFFQKKQ